MAPLLLTLADLILLFGLTLRLTRLLITDDVGLVLRYPVDRRAARARITRLRLPADDPRRSRLAVSEWAERGLGCGFCAGFWVGAAALASLLWVGGPGADGTAVTVWRAVAGVFTLNWLAAHVALRAGDLGYADDDGDED